MKNTTQPHLDIAFDKPFIYSEKLCRNSIRTRLAYVSCAGMS